MRHSVSIFFLSLSSKHLELMRLCHLPFTLFPPLFSTHSSPSLKNFKTQKPYEKVITVQSHSSDFDIFKQKFVDPSRVLYMSATAPLRFIPNEVILSPNKLLNDASQLAHIRTFG